jgi:phosphoglycolate phosphatase
MASSGPAGENPQRALHSPRRAASGRIMGTIIFDLDGTLVDTAPDLIATLNVILSREGVPAVPEDEARILIGHGARRMLERGLERAGVALADLAGATPEETGMDRLFRDFIAYYTDHLADRSRPYPGVEAALDALAGRGCTFAVCTNKLEGLSVRLLTRLGLAGRFAAICGQDTFPVRKPHPEALLLTLHRAGGSLDRAVMVGDSVTDIATAKAASMPVVAVDFGYTDVPVQDLGPDRVISHYSHLPDAVAVLLETAGRAALAK